MLPKPYYSRDGITLYHGDCLPMLAVMPEGCVHAVVTDPPYSSGGMFRGDRQRSTREKYQSSGVAQEHPTFTGDSRDQRGWAKWVALWLIEAAEVCVPGGVLCVFTDWRQLPSATDAVQAGGWLWLGVIPWDKGNGRPMPNRFRSQAEFIVWGTNGPRDFSTDGATYHDGAFRFLAPPSADREHSTQKPVGLLEKLVAIAREGETVLDPFAGSGTTGVACARTGRKFIGIEKEEAYCEIAARRLEAAAQETPLFA